MRKRDEREREGWRERDEEERGCKEVGVRRRGERERENRTEGKMGERGGHFTLFQQ